MKTRKLALLESGGPASRPPGFIAILPSHVSWHVECKSRGGTLRAAPAHGLAPLVGARGCGRDEHRCPPPAQIRTSGITAYGSSLGYERRSVCRDRDAVCGDEESTVRR